MKTQDPMLSALPTDLYTPTQDAATEWNQLEQTSAEARFRRMDIVASLYLDELPRGKAGVLERVGKRLHLEEGDKKSRIVIGDAWRTFRTFRLTGDQGLGFSREELVNIPVSRLRAVAQNHDWAMKNKGEIRELIVTKEEEALREHIRQDTPEKAQKKPAFASRELRFTIEDAAAFDDLLKAIEAKATEQGETVSQDEKTKRGQLVTLALTEWLITPQPVMLNNGRPMLDEHDQVVMTDNIRFLPTTEERQDAAD
ncbi:hypothetical protein [Deinococcus alpinitundrae]|uniref:hypothetical protein n=1 Tax=Deinococcus alpinitundrae TaxID=468913 RepID=UPI00137A1119|nr:hypothetical protein [Deinococcus alpinitundrae]